jgi:hypothetical protein
VRLVRLSYALSDEDHMHRTVAVPAAFVVAISTAYGAQSASLPAEPTNAAVAVPEPKYDSAFTAYQPYREPAVVDWRALNDEVGAIGGHVGIFKGAGHASHGSKPQTSAPMAVGTQPQAQTPVDAPAKAPASQTHPHQGVVDGKH